MKSTRHIDVILTSIGYLLAVAPFVVLGGYVAASAKILVAADNLGLTLIIMGVLLLLAVVFLYLHIIIHEGGHMVCALLSGWKFLSFRVGNFVLVEQDGKLKLKKTTVVGTGGQCLMIPPNVKYEDCPYFLYFLGGGTANILTGAVAFLVGLLVNPAMQVLFNMFAIIGIGLGVSNLFPAKMSGIMNDGYQMFIEIPESSDSKKYMYCLMSANAILTEQESTQALPENIRTTILEIDDGDMDNYFAVNLLLFKNSILQEEGKYEEVQQICRKIVAAPDMLQVFKNEAMCELLYYEIMGEGSKEKIEKLADKNLMKYIKATSVYPSRRRLMYAYHLIYRNDLVAAENEYQALLKTAKTHPSKAESAIEIKEAERVKAYFESREKLNSI